MSQAIIRADRKARANTSGLFDPRLAEHGPYFAITGNEFEASCSLLRGTNLTMLLMDLVLAMCPIVRIMPPASAPPNDAASVSSAVWHHSTSLNEAQGLSADGITGKAR